MTYAQMVAKIVCEAKGLPDTIAPALVTTMIQGVALAGISVEPLLKQVPPSEARQTLQECRRDKAKTLAWLAECEKDTAAMFASKAKK